MKGNTMTIITNENDFDGVYGTKTLSATGLGDGKMRVKIRSLSKEQLQGRNPGEPPRPRIVLDFVETEKRLVLNATNFGILRDSLGRDPKSWIGAEIGISAEATTFSGRRVMGLRVKVLTSDSVPF
jgi:hypothetical protein